MAKRRRIVGRKEYKEAVKVLSREWGVTEERMEEILQQISNEAMEEVKKLDDK